jgi:hypothetical protein
MNASINGISQPDLGWLRMEHQMLNFRLATLQKDMHFTISFDDRSLDVNLHLVRNTNHPVGKPRIEIARMSKTELNILLPDIQQVLMQIMIRPLTIQPLGRRSSRRRFGVAFLPFERFGPESKDPLQKLLLETIKPQIRKKRGIMKLLPTLEHHMEALAQSPKYKKIVENSLVWMRRTPPTGFQGGFLITRKFTGCAILANGRWYAIRQDINPLEFFLPFMERSLIDQLNERIQSAIKIVSLAQSALDSELHNKPIRLHLLSPEQELAFDRHSPKFDEIVF